MHVIDGNSVVGISYVLKGEAGEVLDKSSGSDPFVFLMGVEAIVPGLEKALLGKTVGNAFSVSLNPEEAYGQPHQDLVGHVPRSQFPSDLEITRGMRFQCEVAGGIRMVAIREIEGDTITIDANHELAGRSLHFDINVESVRSATAQEISHRHVHHGDECDHGHDH
ncbi:MAG: peptidylprolyl isomerase [Opitutaceae bacterium]|nr:peptidylprolyl isomerase [Opitutaceae bacterium]|tara:strand:- start:410 stop:907 length:498 start_codon:yes stop_codon:yes gene_type:complete